MELKTKSIPVSGVKVLDAEQGIVEAFVAGIGNKDSVGDIIQPGAFTDSLAARKPKGVWSHDWDKPVAKTLDVREVAAGHKDLPVKMANAGIGGLYVKTQFNLATQRGKDAFADVVFYGDEAEWSIGYREVETEYDEKQKALLLHKIDLYEYSPVLFGANPLTSTVGIKTAQALREAAKAVADHVEPTEEQMAALEALSALLEDEAPEVKDDDETPPEVKDDDIVQAAEDHVAETTVAASEKQSVPGSYEARRDAIRTAVQSWVSDAFGSDDGYAPYSWPCVTFDSTVVASVEYHSEDDGWVYTYFQFDYLMSGDDAILANPTEVDLVQTVVAKGEGSALTPAVTAALASMPDLAEAVGALTLLATDDGRKWAAERLGVDLEDVVDKAGRVLSAANFAKIEAAQTALAEVIAAATPAAEPAKVVEPVEAKVNDDPAEPAPADAEVKDDDAETVIVADDTVIEVEGPPVTVEDLAFLESLSAELALDVEPVPA